MRLSFTVCDAVPQIETAAAAGKQKEKKEKGDVLSAIIIYL